MTQVLDGKVAVVTGAGRGIGKAIADTLAGYGAQVVAADISGDEVGAAIDIGRGAVACHVDVTSPSSVAAMVSSTVARFGTVDILCNNAGIDGDIAPTAESTVENFDRVTAVNLRGVFLATRYVLPVMLEQCRGSIVNIASVAAVNAIPGGAAYCAAKAGVIGLTRAVAADHSRSGIRVNAILPGVIETPMYTQLKVNHPALSEAITAKATMTASARPGTATEVAEVVAFLASDASSYITGAALPVDGGYTA